MNTDALCALILLHLLHLVRGHGVEEGGLVWRSKGLRPLRLINWINRYLKFNGGCGKMVPSKKALEACLI